MTLLAIFGLGPLEIAVVAVFGVLLFGRKLPDTGRYLGKSITEFRKGVKGLEDDIDPPEDPGAAGVFARLKPIPPDKSGYAR